VCARAALGGDLRTDGARQVIACRADGNHVLAGLEPGRREAIDALLVAHHGDGLVRIGFLRADQHPFHDAFLGGGDLSSQRVGLSGRWSCLERQENKRCNDCGQVMPGPHGDLLLVCRVASSKYRFGMRYLPRHRSTGPSGSSMGRGVGYTGRDRIVESTMRHSIVKYAVRVMLVWGAVAGLAAAQDKSVAPGI